MPSKTSSSSTGDDPYLLTTKELASKIGLPERTIKWLVYKHRIPRVMLGYRTMRFRLDSVKQALAEREKV